MAPSETLRSYRVQSILCLSLKFYLAVTMLVFWVSS